MDAITKILKDLDMSVEDRSWLVMELEEASANLCGTYVDPEYADRQSKVVTALARLADVVAEAYTL